MTKTNPVWGTALIAVCLVLSCGVASAQIDFTVTDTDLPTGLAWDEAYGARIQVTHVLGSDPITAGTHAWVSVDGVTGAAVPADRWGLLHTAPNIGNIISTDFWNYDFTITGPALTSLQYTAPVGLTAPGEPLSVDCNWLLASPYTPTPSFPYFDADQTVEADVVVSRFPDVGQLVVGWYYIEQLAGRVPLVVKGYPNGTYGPALTVDREQMAIFMARALDLPLLACEGTFTDVPDTMVGAQYIEALARANIVSGFSATIYGPAGIVTREQMAIFVSRGMAGGDANVPSGPAVATFSDVPTSAVSYNYVEYCVAAEVVKGYSATIYGPTVNVTREQMAIFIWRGFMVSTGVPVVIGGPAATGVEPDPAVAGYLGWSSEQLDPSWAYVALDALRIDANLAVGGTWDITLEVRDAAAPTGAVIASTSVNLSTAQISTIWNAAVLSGDPYLIVKWDVSAESLAAGDYILVALVEDSAGVMQEVGWKRAAGTYVGRFFPFTVS